MCAAPFFSHFFLSLYALLVPLFNNTPPHHISCETKFSLSEALHACVHVYMMQEVLNTNDSNSIHNKHVCRPHALCTQPSSLTISPYLPPPHLSHTVFNIGRWGYRLLPAQPALWQEPQAPPPWCTRAVCGMLTQGMLTPPLRTLLPHRRQCQHLPFLQWPWSRIWSKMDCRV